MPDAPACPPIEKLRGRWFEEKQQRWLDFSEKSLFAFAGNGVLIEAGVWSVEGDETVFTYHTGERRGDTERWKPTFQGDKSFTIVGPAFVRKFIKDETRVGTHDTRLVGLWRTDEEYPQVADFTAHSTLIGWNWSLDPETKTTSMVGVSAEVSRASSNEFYLEGFFGSGELTKGRVHKYRVEAGKLFWKKPAKRRSELVFRQIAASDITLGPPPGETATPSSDPTP